MQGPSVWLVENSPLFHLALTTTLGRLGFSVVALDPTGGVVRCRKEPDAILMDLVTFSGSPEELHGSIKRLSRRGPVLLLAQDNRIEQILTGLKAGAVGFVKRTAPLKELRSAIKAIASGSTYCDRKIFCKIMRYLPVAPSLQESPLTKREQEILRFVSLGQTNKEIGRGIGLAEQTIKAYVSRLLRKTGAANRSGLTLRAISRGLVEAP